MFFDMYKYLYSESVLNTLDTEMKHKMLKKILSHKINGLKNALFLLLRAPNHHSFTFNLRFFYELKYKVRLFKYVCEILHFPFRFIFIKVYIFLQQNAWTL